MGICRKHPKCTVVCCVFLVYCLMTSGSIDATLRHHPNHHRHTSHHLSSLSSSSSSSSLSPQSSTLLSSSSSSSSPPPSVFTSVSSDSFPTTTSSLSSYTSSSSTSSSLEFKNSADQIFAEDSEIEDDESSSHSKDNFQLSRSQNDFYKRFMGAANDAKDHPSQQTTPQKEPLVPRARMPYGLSKGLLEIRKANEHYLKVYTNARCKFPKARVVRVKEYYPDPSKEYLPSCTIIHKCGDDTGCCDSESMQCVAKKQDIVELYFYKLHLHHSGGGIGISSTNTVEKLAFLNDTECECQDVDDRPRIYPLKRVCLKCPSGFTLRESQPGVCQCDCFDKQKSCLKMKRGRERLSDYDRRCVDARRCHQPECEYGQYDPTIGRCPRKHERQNTNLSDHHRWRFDERD